MPATAASVGHNDGSKRKLDIAGQRVGAWATLQSVADYQMKIIVILFIVLILASLGSALYFMVKDKGASTRTAKALTWRVVFSITLFALLMLGFHFGIITTKL